MCVFFFFFGPLKRKGKKILSMVFALIHYLAFRYFSPEIGPLEGNTIVLEILWSGNRDSCSDRELLR